jgi:hypothetical protein
MSSTCWAAGHHVVRTSRSRSGDVVTAGSTIGANRSRMVVAARVAHDRVLLEGSIPVRILGRDSSASSFHSSRNRAGMGETRHVPKCAHSRSPPGPSPRDCGSGNAPGAPAAQVLGRETLPEIAGLRSTAQVNGELLAPLPWEPVNSRRPEELGGRPAHPERREVGGSHRVFE